ncbi:MAG: hypothetical protein HYR76_02595 [Ignavibacteria bacterium]|nr:hypothetical protein [Ignavibacteria bacterium]MBI3765884.1 hypothetical protein [Ignavibacteriales bacterium]
MNSSILLIVAILLICNLLGCESQKKDSSATIDEANPTWVGGSVSKKYEMEMKTLQGKIRQHKSTRGEMFTLCEKILQDEDIRADIDAMAGVYLFYGLNLEADNQFQKAEECVRKAEELTLKSKEEKKKVRLAGIYISLGRIYQAQKNSDKTISTLKYVIENFQDATNPKGTSSEYYSSFAVNVLGSFYEKSERLAEGIDYFNSICKKYSGTRTSHAALAQIYDLQMSKGDKVNAESTKQTLEKELQLHPEYTIQSSIVLEKWKVVK